MSKEQLEYALQQGSRTAPNMRKALHAVVVDGVTWRQAAITYDVTESGIMRAMRRLGIGRYAKADRLDLAMHAKNISA